MSPIETAIMKIYIISHGENGEIVDLGDLDPLTYATVIWVDQYQDQRALYCFYYISDFFPCAYVCFFLYICSLRFITEMTAAAWYQDGVSCLGKLNCTEVITVRYCFRLTLQASDYCQQAATGSADIRYSTEVTVTRLHVTEWQVLVYLVGLSTNLYHA